jgi:predicted AAA+ superfamily ATPase
MLKTRLNRGLDPGLWFWRDSLGHEVDVVFEDGPLTRAIEIKSRQTFTTQFAAGLETWTRFSRQPKPARSSMPGTKT